MEIKGVFEGCYADPVALNAQGVPHGRVAYFFRMLLMTIVLFLPD